MAALTTAHWNRKHAAALLSLEYKSFLYRMKKLGIDSKPAAKSAYPATVSEEHAIGVASSNK